MTDETRKRSGHDERSQKRDERDWAFESRRAGPKRDEMDQATTPKIRRNGSSHDKTDRQADRSTTCELEPLVDRNETTGLSQADGVKTRASETNEMEGPSHDWRDRNEMNRPKSGENEPRETIDEMEPQRVEPTEIKQIGSRHDD